MADNVWLFPGVGTDPNARNPKAEAPAGTGPFSAEQPAAETASTIAAGQLRSLVERIEHLEAEISELNDDKKEVYGEAKATGFDVKALKRVVHLRRMDAAERAEFETIVDLYKHALGMD